MKVSLNISKLGLKSYRAFNSVVRPRYSQNSKSILPFHFGVSFPHSCIHHQEFYVIGFAFGWECNRGPDGK